MSTKSEIEVTGMNDDQLVVGAKERQEFEASASGDTKDTCRRKQMQKGREHKKKHQKKDKEYAVETEKNMLIVFENFQTAGNRRGCPCSLHAMTLLN